MDLVYTLTQEDIERGKRICFLRKRRGLTQADIARELKVSVNTVSGWEAGKRISVKHRHGLCLLLHIPCEVIGEEPSLFTDPRNFQINILRQLELCPRCQRKVEEAINLYYEVNDLSQKKTV